MRKIILLFFCLLLTATLRAQVFQPGEYDGLMYQQYSCPSDMEWIPNRGAPGCNHSKACNTAFTAKRLKWLFEQKKSVK